MNSFILEKVLAEWNEMRTLEVWGTILGIAQVIFAYKNKAINFLFAILSSLIMIYIFAFSNAKLYAEAILQLYYLILGIYGWFQWTKTDTNSAVLEVQFANRRNWVIASIIILLGITITYFILYTFTDSDVPFGDASVFGLAWAGTYLMTQRKVENWLILNLSNLVAIPLLLYKELYFFSILTIILFLIGCLGYLKWRKMAQHSKNKSL